MLVRLSCGPQPLHDGENVTLTGKRAIPSLTLARNGLASAFTSGLHTTIGCNSQLFSYARSVGEMGRRHLCSVT